MHAARCAQTDRFRRRAGRRALGGYDAAPAIIIVAQMVSDEMFNPQIETTSSMFTAAVFDMDGLLLDSERPIRNAWFQVARQAGVALSDAVYLDAVGRNWADTRATISRLFGDELAFERAQASVDKMLSDRYGVQGYALKDGVIELLAALRKRGVPCCVASSTKAAEVRRRLEQACISGYFHAIAGGDEVARGKPHPDLFVLAARRLGVNPGRCLVFEDSEYGAWGAVAAGMSAVIVPDLKTPTADTQAMCVAQLQTLVQAIPLCEFWFEQMSGPK